jgi:uncharacterized protein YecT (DUF1311 family)
MRLFPLMPCLLVVSATIAIAPVHGQSSKSTTGPAKTAVPKIDCAMATATAELNHCAEIRLKKADSELSSALEKVRMQIAKRAGAAPYDKPTWTAAIDDADKTWKSYREADCKGLVPHEWQGGTGTALAVLECMAQMTEQRAFELTERYAERR